MILKLDLIKVDFCGISLNKLTLEAKKSYVK